MEPSEEVEGLVSVSSDLKNTSDGQDAAEYTSTPTDIVLSTDMRPTPCKLRRVAFKKVEVFYFERLQGFVCVPSQGGSTLGMALVHSAFEEFTVSDHQQVRQLERYLSLIKKFENGKISLTDAQLSYLNHRISSAPDICKHLVHKLQNQNSTGLQHASLPICQSEDAPGCVRPFSSLCTQENSAQNCSLGYSEKFGTKLSSTYLYDEDMEAQLGGLMECYFLQLLSIKKRRLLLRKSGLKSIDHAERLECQAIRMSREICGCSCPSGICLPDTCYCARNGIKCQVDRPFFPCCCVQPSQCQNPEGRIEFDPIRVRTHYLHTRMRLDKEQIVHSLVTGGWALSNPQQTEEPTLKKPRLDASAIISVPTSSQDFELLHDVPVSETERNKSSNPDDDDDVLCVYNTTSSGACRACQNDRYVQTLMQQLGPTASEDESDVISGDAGFSLSEECLEVTDTIFVETSDNLESSESNGTQSALPDPNTVEVATKQPGTHIGYSTEQFASCSSEEHPSCADTLLTTQPPYSIESRSDCFLVNSDKLNHNGVHLPCFALSGVETQPLQSSEPTEDMTPHHRRSPLEPISSLFSRCISSNPAPSPQTPVHPSTVIEVDYSTCSSSINDNSVQNSSFSLAPTSPSETSSDSTLPSTLEASPESSPRATSPYVEGVTA